MLCLEPEASKTKNWKLHHWPMTFSGEGVDYVFDGSKFDPFDALPIFCIGVYINDTLLLTNLCILEADMNSFSVLCASDFRLVSYTQKPYHYCDYIYCKITHDKNNCPYDKNHCPFDKNTCPYAKNDFHSDKIFLTMRTLLSQ